MNSKLDDLIKLKGQVHWMDWSLKLLWLVVIVKGIILFYGAG